MITAFLDKVDPIEFLILISILPAVFVFLWVLIFVDFKNFVGSRKAYTVYNAQDPVNCYQNFTQKKAD